MKNIVLIGFMGTGKTSTGRMLAARLGAAFIDMDQRIEEETGMSIPAMFEKKGESFFRSREKQLVRRLSARRNAVISTGGGTVKDPENVAMLHRDGVIRVGIGFMAARTITSSPFVMPPSSPPARLVLRYTCPDSSKKISS